MKKGDDMRVYLKMVKRLVASGMKPEKALSLVCGAYVVDIHSLTNVYKSEI